MLWVLICVAHLTVCSCHAIYAFQSEYTLYSCLNIKDRVWETVECRFTLKRVRISRTYSHMHDRDEYSQQISIIWPVWLNGWVFVYELSDCGFKSLLHLNFRYSSGWSKEFLDFQTNYRVYIHYKTRTWNDKNIQSNAQYRLVLTTRLNHLESLAKCLSVRLGTTWLWVRILLLSHKTSYMASALSKEFLDIQANHRAWIHSETCTLNDNNIQSIVPYW